MKFEYGISDRKIDITNVVLEKFCLEDTINIIGDDFFRTKYFTDPVFGISKNIFVTDNFGSVKKYKSHENIIDLKINTKFEERNEKSSHDVYLEKGINFITDSVEKLSKIQEILKIENGSFLEEYPEQLMTTMFLKGDEKILEIGSNIGRNSLIIGTILNDSKNLVTLETNESDFYITCKNKENNNLNFQCVNAALSKRKLIQKNWDTIPSDVLLDGYKNVTIISYEELVNKTKVVFDTLVLDCEGAFYYILLDEPNILNNINLIIMENDYSNPEHKKYIDEQMLGKNFRKLYQNENGYNFIGNFYEVWGK